MAREPFQYPDWCAGPEVDLDISSGFPVCTPLSMTAATAGYATPCIPPFMAPPPFCPCLGTIAPGNLPTGTPRSSFHVGHTAVEFFEMLVVPASANMDCCSPSYRMTYNLEIPCLPFDIQAGVTMEPGRAQPSFNVTKTEGTCQFCFSLALPPSRPFTLEFSSLGQGVTFVNNCSGAGAVSMSASLVSMALGTLKLKLRHFVSLNIPLIGRLANVD